MAISFVAVVIWVNVVPGLSALSHPVFYNLGPCDWTVQNFNKSINVRASVPGGIYTDLRRAGVLKKDIFYRFNDEDYRWVSKDNWTYKTSFNVDPGIMKKKYIYLDFEGIDTVAKVLLNGQLLGEPENMFVQYNFSVKDKLKESDNKLEVQFTSPVVAAKQASQKTPYLVPPECVPSDYNGECHVNYLRKMQASFSWDWGPAFPSMGIWKDVGLRAYDIAFARHIGVETLPEDEDWRVSVILYLDIDTSASGTLTVSLVLNDTHKITSERPVTVSPDHNTPSMVFSVPKKSVELWWPNGHGKQPLYRLTVGFRSDQEITQKTIKIGFRTISLIQMEAVSGQPDKGLTFFFRVNGMPVFAKGSNYIPAHILPELGYEPGRVRHLLTSTRDANMNMLRVWGGGLYESDLFYEICDELGILIWQDLMFACSMYPATEQFLASVALEVSQQVKRLQHHACIAIWAGNNENEAALVGNWYGTGRNFSLFKSDYVKLYVNTVKPIMDRLDKTRTYVTSSPSNGLETEKEGYVADNPYDTKFGDIHWYQYGMNLWNPIIFPIPRFSSEYGITALPSLDSFANITEKEDLSLDSLFFNKRQHHMGGYSQMEYEIKDNMYLPENADLETYIYLSQINQAMSIKTETEFYRQWRSRVNSAGEGYTMGALYWQLNDVWQAPSWASIELSGKWKMLHYFAADFFAPVLVSPTKDIHNELHVYVISDLKLHSSQNLVMRLTIYNWNSLEPASINHYPFTMLGAGVVEVGSWNIPQLLQSVNGCKSGASPEKNCFFHFSILMNIHENSSSTLGPDNFFFPAPLHSVNSPAQAKIQVTDIKSLKNNLEFIVTLSTDVIAPFVWLDTVGIPGHFSHNGFLMVTHESQVTFTSQQTISTEELRDALKVKSLRMH